MKNKSQLDIMKSIRKPMSKPSISFNSKKRKIVNSEHKKQIKEYV